MARLLVANELDNRTRFTAVVIGIYSQVVYRASSWEHSLRTALDENATSANAAVEASVVLFPICFEANVIQWSLHVLLGTFKLKWIKFDCYKRCWSNKSSGKKIFNESVWKCTIRSFPSVPQLNFIWLAASTFKSIHSDDIMHWVNETVRV